MERTRREALAVGGATVASLAAPLREHRRVLR